jgi:hypothetical protein
MAHIPQNLAKLGRDMGPLDVAPGKRVMNNADPAQAYSSLRLAEKTRVSRYTRLRDQVKIFYFSPPAHREYKKPAKNLLNSYPLCREGFKTVGQSASFPGMLFNFILE